MALNKERKEQLAEHLRGTSVAKENITPEYRKNLELADKETVIIPVGENDEVTCYIFTAKNRTANRNIRFPRLLTRRMRYAAGHFPSWANGMRMKNGFPWEDTARART